MKKLFNILCILFFASFVLLPLSAQAENDGIVEVTQDEGLGNGSGGTASSKALVVDDAGLLSPSQAEALQQKLASVSARYNCDVVLVTKADIAGTNVTAYADDYFDNNSYGQGSENEGILFLITMAEREWAISTSGHDTITIFSDWRQNQISGKMIPFLKSGDYAGAFNAYAQSCEYYLSRGLPSDETLTNEENGYAGEREEKGPLDPVWGFISGLIGLISSWLGTSAKRSKYRTVFEKTTAAGYERLAASSGNNADRFVRTFTTRTARPTERTVSSGYSHSSTHTSSSGHTHGGSHGSF